MRTPLEFNHSQQYNPSPPFILPPTRPERNIFFSLATDKFLTASQKEESHTFEDFSKRLRLHNLYPMQ